MGQKIAQLQNRIVEIVAEHRVAQMLDEDAPQRRAVIEDAAIMAGAGPELVAFLGVIDEGAEERRLQRLAELLDAADQVLGDEFGGFLGQEDIAVDVIQHLDRNVFQALAAHQHDDRHFETAPAHQVDQGGCFMPRRGALAPIDQHASDGGVGLDGYFGVSHAPGTHHLEAELAHFGDDLLDAHALQIIGVEGRGIDQNGQSPGKIHRILHSFFFEGRLERIGRHGHAAPALQQNVHSAGFAIQVTPPRGWCSGTAESATRRDPAD